MHILIIIVVIVLIFFIPIPLSFHLYISKDKFYIKFYSLNLLSNEDARNYKTLYSILKKIKQTRRKEN